MDKLYYSIVSIFVGGEKLRPAINLRPVPEIVKPTQGTTKRPRTLIRNPAVTKAQEFARPSNPVVVAANNGANSAYQLPKNIGEILLKGMRDASINTPRPSIYQMEGGEFVPPATFMYGFKPITKQPTLDFSTQRPTSNGYNQPQGQYQSNNGGAPADNNYKSPQKTAAKYKSYRGGKTNQRPRKSTGRTKSSPTVIDKISNFLEPFTLPFKAFFKSSSR